MSAFIEVNGRHQIDGKDVHCGDCLDLEVLPNVWLPMRYEANWTERGIDVQMITPHGTLHPRYKNCNWRWPRRGA